MLMLNVEVARKSYPPAAFPTRSCPRVGAVDVPVPPFATPNIPVTSLARSSMAAETVPAVAFRTPVKDPIESAPKNPCVDDAYTAEIFVVDAFAKVWSALKVFAVNVFGIVVDAPRKVLTSESL